MHMRAENNMGILDLFPSEFSSTRAACGTADAAAAAAAAAEAWHLIMETTVLRIGGESYISLITLICLEHCTCIACTMFCARVTCMWNLSGTCVGH